MCTNVHCTQVTFISSKYNNVSVTVLNIFLNTEVAVAALECPLDAGLGHSALCLSAHLHHNVSLNTFLVSSLTWALAIMAGAQAVHLASPHFSAW